MDAKTLIIITATVIVIALFYRKSYMDGLAASIFFLILMPKNIAIYISYSLPSITVHRIIIAIMLTFWVFLKDERKDAAGEIPFRKTILIMVIATGMSALVSENMLVSVKRYMYFLVESILFYLVIVKSINTDQEARKIFRVASMALLGAAFIGLYEKSTGVNIADLVTTTRYYSFENIVLTGRDVESTFLHRILFGVAMASGFLISLSCVDLADSVKQKLYFFGSALICGAALFYSMSRGPWLALIISSCFISVLNINVAKKMIPIAGLVLLVLIVKPGTYESIRLLVDSTFDPTSIKGSSYNWRFQVLEAAKNEIIHARDFKNTVFGFGQGSHTFRTYGVVTMSSDRQAELLSWDNEYAVMILEHGVVGFAIIFFFHFIVGTNIVFGYINSKEKYQTVLLCISIIAVIFFMKTNVKIFAPQIVYLEFLSIGVGAKLLAGEQAAFAPNA